MDAWTMALTVEDSMRFFVSPKSPVWPWGPMSFLSNGSHGILLWAVKQPQHKPNQTPQSSTKVKNVCGLSSISLSCCSVSEREHMHRKHEYIYMHTHKYLDLFNCWKGKTKDEKGQMQGTKASWQPCTNNLFFGTKKKLYSLYSRTTTQKYISKCR
jgi:hypothetical protein